MSKSEGGKGLFFSLLSSFQTDRRCHSIFNLRRVLCVGDFTLKRGKNVGVFNALTLPANTK